MKNNNFFEIPLRARIENLLKEMENELKNLIIDEEIEKYFDDIKVSYKAQGTSIDIRDSISITVYLEKENNSYEYEFTTNSLNLIPTESVILDIKKMLKFSLEYENENEVNEMYNKMTMCHVELNKIRIYED